MHSFVALKPITNNTNTSSLKNDNKTDELKIKISIKIPDIKTYFLIIVDS